MGSDAIPESVRTFLQKNIHSVNQLEILLFIHQSRGQGRSAEAISHTLQLDPNSVLFILEDLEQNQLIYSGMESDKNRFYVSSDPQITNNVDLLAKLYETHRVRIVELIYAPSINPLMPTYFISHGGGPWPYMPEMSQHYNKMAQTLADIPNFLPCVPQAILMVSAHWEEHEVTMLSHPTPPMLYDYGGFPPHTYEVKYPAKNDIKLLQKASDLLTTAGHKVHYNSKRGFDHGAFVPLQVMFPNADIPVVQVSLLKNLSPSMHLNIGKALVPLRSEGYLIIGSGFSYHNLHKFGPEAKIPSQDFDAWLNKTLLHKSNSEREAELLAWETAPSARIAHPREDHLIPLFVALGAAADEKASCFYHEVDFFGGISVSSFRFG